MKNSIVDLEASSVIVIRDTIFILKNEKFRDLIDASDPNCISIPWSSKKHMLDMSSMKFSQNGGCNTDENSGNVKYIICTEATRRFALKYLNYKTNSKEIDSLVSSLSKISLDNISEVGESLFEPQDTSKFNFFNDLEVKLSHCNPDQTPALKDQKDGKLFGRSKDVAHAERHQLRVRKYLNINEYK